MFINETLNNSQTNEKPGRHYEIIKSIKQG